VEVGTLQENCMRAHSCCIPRPYLGALVAKKIEGLGTRPDCTVGEQSSV